MHNGRFATLRDVVKHYSQIDVTLLHHAPVYAGDVIAEAVATDPVLQPLHLCEREISDLVAFLETPSERAGFRSERKTVTKNCLKSKG